MSTLIKKELRENFKLALIGLALFTFMLAMDYHSSALFYANLALGGGWNADNAQPMISNSTAATGLFCSIFAAVLGWLQIHNERHRDLWAFLIHRPMSRTKIFVAKTVAGLSLYLVCAGLPLLGFIIMVGLPGHLAAPFDWAMVLPATSFFLSGIVYYFAGMLTSLRQARWFASRGLGLGAAILVSVALGNATDFSRAFVVVLVGSAILATAAWGSFLSSGYYSGQPVWGRRALASSLMLGCVVVVGLVAILFMSMLPRENQNRTWFRYQITKDGNIFKVTHATGKPGEITELNGTPLKDSKTGHPITQTDFDRLAAPESGVQPQFRDPAKAQLHYGSYQDVSHYFTLWQQTFDTLWYWRPNGRLWAYDIASRRFLGSLGPDGFAPGASTGAARFNQPVRLTDASQPVRTLTTDHAVYQLDLDHHAAKLFFEATNSDRIGGAVDVSSRGYGWDYTIVVTKDFIHLLTSDGKLVWQTPYAPGYPAYYYAQVSFLEPSTRFALTLYPSNQEDSTNHLPLHVAWLAAGQGVLTNLDLPLVQPAWTQPWGKCLTGLAMPPVSIFVMKWFEGLTLARLLSVVKLSWPPVIVSLIAAVVCAVAGWWLGRRYHFTVAARLKWAVFHLLTGLPGFLGFLCVQEWPAREPCPNCKKPRLVDREKCEYCGADFAPPPKNGTEIFESDSAATARSTPAVALRE